MDKSTDTASEEDGREAASAAAEEDERRENLDSDDRADEAAGNTATTTGGSQVQSLERARAVESNDGNSDAATNGSKPARTAVTNNSRPKMSTSIRRQQHLQLQQRPSLQNSNSSNSSTFMNQSMRNLRRQSSQSFHALKRQSSTFFESINSNLPTSPSGWALFALGTASVGLQYELHVQKELTAPPIVFCQNSKNNEGGYYLNGRMDRLFDKLSRRSHNNNKSGDDRSNKDGDGKKNEIEAEEEEGIFARKVTPSLFIGTRGIMSSTAAYALGDGNSNKQVKRVREVMRMAADGALIVLDWEIPLARASINNSDNTANNDLSQTETEQSIDIKSPNSIDKPVILLVHGMNNDSSFGYIRSMMRTATERGWIAVCMNLRGQDGMHQVKNATPRGYNAGYTGDVRGVVQQIEHRLKRREKGMDRDTQQQTAATNATSNTDNGIEYEGGPIFLLGYSLGANIITKYLGEESLHGTLPKCIGGGAAMGNPLYVHSGTVKFPWNVLLASGVKRSLLQNFHSFRAHHDPGYQHSFWKAMLSSTIGKLDDAAAPYLARNDPFPPYTPRIGFKDGEDYWWDSSSHRYVAHVSVPLLKISAQDDFLVFGQFARKLNHCLENPNVVVVKTRCGGHLGWQESPPPSTKKKKKKGKGGSSSWSDVAVADFIEALLQIREEEEDCNKKKRMKEELKSSQPPSMPRVLSKL